MVGSTARTSRHTSMPLPSGSLASKIATFGRSAGMRCTASTAEPVSPTTSMSPSWVSRSAMPRRTTSWSSRRNTRITLTFVPLRGPGAQGLTALIAMASIGTSGSGPMALPRRPTAAQAGHGSVQRDPRTYPARRDSQEAEMETTMTIDTATANAALERAARLSGLAPSIHNTQPWHWRIAAGHADLHADLARQLAVNDPDRRMLTISCGGALAHLMVGLDAAGCGYDVAVMPN